jgi:small subunit ribosomal protein S20
MMSDSCPAPARPASRSHHQPSPEGVSPKVQAVANIKSQIKRNKQNERRRLRNKAVRSELKTRQKLAITAAETGGEDTVELTREAMKRLDKAASKGVIHKNQAARRKSRLMKRITAAEAAAATK